jgi:hypothetical protein
MVCSTKAILNTKGVKMMRPINNLKCIIQDPDHMTSNKDEQRFSNFITIAIDDLHECEGALDIRVISATSAKNINRSIILLSRILENMINNGKVSMEEMELMNAENLIDAKRIFNEVDRNIAEIRRPKQSPES